MNFQKFAQESLDYLESLKPGAQKEAAKLFPNHTKAQKVWVKLKTGGGGIEEVVKTLSLQKEYKAYIKEFDSYFDKGLTESASLCVEDFVKYCLQELKENFYMFK